MDGLSIKNDMKKGSIWLLDTYESERDFFNSPSSFDHDEITLNCTSMRREDSGGRPALKKLVDGFYRLLTLGQAET